MECMQQAGDLLYVPGHWHHAVLNMDTVVGLTQQMGSVRDLMGSVLDRLASASESASAPASASATEGGDGREEGS